MMVFINDCYKAEVIPTEYAEGFVKLLAPIAPHVAEELWAILGHEGAYLLMSNGQHTMSLSL